MDAEWVAVLLTLAGFLGSLVNALWARHERVAAGAAAADAHQVQESIAASQASIAASLAKPSVAFVVEAFGSNWMLKNIGQDAASGLLIEWPNFTYPQRDVPDVLEPGNELLSGQVQDEPVRDARSRCGSSVISDPMV